MEILHHLKFLNWWAKIYSNNIKYFSFNFSSLVGKYFAPKYFHSRVEIINGRVESLLILTVYLRIKSYRFIYRQLYIYKLAENYQKNRRQCLIITLIFSSFFLLSYFLHIGVTVSLEQFVLKTATVILVNFWHVYFRKHLNAMVI